jgi:hypothetical protein
MNFRTGALRGALFVLRQALAVLLAVGALSVGSVAASHVPHHNVIIDSPGGRLDLFYIRYSMERRRGDTFEIDGECDSACTLITALIPPSRVCITTYARLGFHSAFNYMDDGSEEFAPEATAWMWRMYPPKVRALLRANGWSGPTEHPDLIWIDADDLLSIYKPCP